MSVTAKFIRLWDGITKAVIDAITGSVAVIPVEHLEVHEGDYYTVSDYDNDVDIAAPKYWHIKTPDTAVRGHTVMAVTSGLAALIELFENPTLTNDGVGLTAHNNDRNSGNAATLNVYRDPVVTADGTRIQVDHVGANNPKNRFGGNIRQETEFILKQNESYLIKVTAEVNDAHVIMNLEFYEIA